MNCNFYVESSHEPGSLRISKPRLWRGAFAIRMKYKICYDERSLFLLRDRGGLVVKYHLWGRRAPGSKPDSTEEPPCMWARCTPNHTQWAKRPHADVEWKLREVGTSSGVVLVIWPRLQIPSQNS
ncbi:hypothetical protein AVEN_32179-1 [Araneus ventricosus]|uniref:Uncharacterized protein n=1 Tax=Araneus ventricosus TaxID=182803 RepID=A0A4Y2S3L7_ARAVE|nr:hypothetical protein AVEN_32179-1 [Araneus ventricosus]